MSSVYKNKTRVLAQPSYERERERVGEREREKEEEEKRKKEKKREKERGREGESYRERERETAARTLFPGTLSCLPSPMLGFLPRSKCT